MLKLCLALFFIVFSGQDLSEPLNIFFALHFMFVTYLALQFKEELSCMPYFKKMMFFLSLLSISINYPNLCVCACVRVILLIFLFYFL